MRWPWLRHERLLRAARVFLVAGALVGSSVAVEACALEDEPGVDPSDPGSLPPDDERTPAHDAGPAGEDASASDAAPSEPFPTAADLRRVLAPIVSDCPTLAPNTFCSITVADLGSKARYAREGTRTYVSASSPKFVWVAAALHAGQTVARVEPLALPIFRTSDNGAAGEVVMLIGPNAQNTFYKGPAGMTSSRFCSFIGTTASTEPGCPGSNLFTSDDAVEFLSRLWDGRLFPADDARRTKLLEWSLEAPDRGLGGYLSEQLPAAVKAKTHHKAGWLPCDSYPTLCDSHDIGIVEVPGQAPYAVAILTQRDSDKPMPDYARQNRTLAYTSCRIYEAMRTLRPNAAAAPAATCVAP